jgi:hypothetical protein
LSTKLFDLVRARLQKEDDASLAEMLRPRTRGTVSGEAADDETVMKEREELSLEDFTGAARIRNPPRC